MGGIELERSWQPLLEGRAAQRAWGMVLGLAQALAERLRARPEGLTPGLGSGSAGIALFLAGLDKARPGEGWDAVAEQALDWTIDGMAEGQYAFALGAGLPGAAWALEHLEGDEEEAAGTATNDVDEAFKAFLGGQAEAVDFGYLDGWSGMGPYALQRYGKGGGKVLLELLVDRLVRGAEADGKGCAWPAPFQNLDEAYRRDYPLGYYNAGVAHGTPGTLGLLARAWGRGCRPPGLEAVLEGAVAWTLAQHRGEGLGHSFAKAAPRGEGLPFPVHRRTAWCYGDLGIASVLFAAGRWARRPEWELEALRLGRGAARCAPVALDRRDACLCHGTAGNAHLFNRLYQATGEACFREAALRWLEETFELHQPGQGVGGFKAWRAEGPGPRQAEPGLMRGAAGIGLALLSALVATVPAWDEVLLVDLPG